MKIGVGTVQFGQDYGISNLGGVTNQSEVHQILSRARKAGVRVIDTAPAYGIAEKVLGQCDIASHGFHVVTKISPLARAGGKFSPADLIRTSLANSLTSIRLSSVYGLLLHDANDLLGPVGGLIYEALRALKSEGLVSKIGVSTYTPEQLNLILADYDLDLVQVPFSVLDQRLLSGGQLKHMKSRGIEIHVRSIFLQGLLLMMPEDLPAHFSCIREHLTRYRSACNEHGLSALQSALGFVSAIPQIDAMICGVNTCEQFTEILEASDQHCGVDWMYQFGLTNLDVIDPSRWPQRT